MIARLAVGVEISALIRRISGAGGTAMVIARGDPQAGAILLWLADRGRSRGLLERRLMPGGDYAWQPTGPAEIEDNQALDAYVKRRRVNDRDLWVLELDIPEVERFAAELRAAG